MHMADALVSPAVGATMYACSAIAAGYSIKKLKIENDPKKLPVMGVMGAFVFATQMINFTIPGTGSSGHLCGGMLLSAIVGPYAAFITMIAVLLIQCLLFADGGILALGCNVWNMAFYGCFIGGLVIWKLFTKNGFSKKKITIASIVGCIVTLQMGAFSVVLETTASRISALPFSVFIAVMQPIHLAIGLVEGLITAAVLVFIHEARPDMLYGAKEIAAENKYSVKKTLAILAVIAALIGGGLSLFASQNPDGLEWSIAQITGDTEVESAGDIYTTAEEIQGATSLLPDYSFSNSDSAAGISFSGIFGAGLLLVVFLGIGTITKKVGRKG